MSGSLVPGGEFGAYRIERMLGAGGMSTVYLAEHVPLTRKVAIKVLSPEVAGDEQFRERFVRESELARRSMSRTFCRSTRRASRTVPCSSRCGTSTARTSEA